MFDVCFPAHSLKHLYHHPLSHPENQKLLLSLLFIYFSVRICYFPMRQKWKWLTARQPSHEHINQDSKSAGAVLSRRASALIYPLIAHMKTNKTSDQSSPLSSHDRSIQRRDHRKRSGSAGGRGRRAAGGMWSGVEDETEYETVKWRSTLLILLFDLHLGTP